MSRHTGKRKAMMDDKDEATTPTRSRAKGKRKVMDRRTQLSKTMSQILRHSATAMGLPVRNDGFAKVDELLALNAMRKLNATDEDVREVVVTNDKQRFALRDED